MPDGTPRVVITGMAQCCFSKHFKDVVYSSYQDDTLPVGVQGEYLLTPTSADSWDTLISYQHLRSILLLNFSDTSQPAITASGLTRIREAAWLLGNTWDSYPEASETSEKVPAMTLQTITWTVQGALMGSSVYRWFLWVSSLEENS